MANLTVIVPIYNREKYLKKCIESILNQTYTDFELLLIDDGSTDNSLEICNHYKALDERVRVITKPNTGLADVRNIGVENTNTEFLAYVDSDDYIHPEMYETLMKKQQEENADIVMCDYMKVDENGNQLINPNIPDLKCEVLSKKEALGKLFTTDSGKIVICCNKIYRKSLFHNVKFPVGRNHEDESVAHKLLYNSDKMVITNDKFYYYVNTSSSIMRGGFSIRRYEAIDAFIDKYEFIKTTEFADEFKDKALVALCGITRKVYSQVKVTPESKKAFYGYLRILRKYIKEMLFAKNYSFLKKLYMIVFLYFPSISKVVKM